MANILAKEVAKINDPFVNDNILRTSMYTPFEKQMFNLMNNHVSNLTNKKAK